MTSIADTVAPNADQLTADDLLARPRTIVVRKVATANADQPVSIFFDGDDGKPFKPCKSMRRVLLQLWGADGNQYVGRSMTLYRDPKVKFGGDEVGGIRISHMSHIDHEVSLPLTTTRGKKARFTVKPLNSNSTKQSAPGARGESVGAVEQKGSPPADERAFQFTITGARGDRHTEDGAVWANTLIAQLDRDKSPNDEDARTIWLRNRLHVAAAARAGFSEQADRVQRAWDARGLSVSEDA